MKFKDYYETLGVKRDATQDEIKNAYRKLARKFHPDVSKEADAEARFKEMGEAYKVLKDPENVRPTISSAPTGKTARTSSHRLTAMQVLNSGGAVTIPASVKVAISVITSNRCSATRAVGATVADVPMHAQGEDHHAKVQIDLEDAYNGAERSISLRMPVVDENGHVIDQGPHA